MRFDVAGAGMAVAPGMGMSCRRLAVPFSVCLALVIAAPLAHAEEDGAVPPRDVSVGVGSGAFFVPRWEGPFARADVQASVPVGVDVGVFVSRHVELGGFGQLAVVLTPKDAALPASFQHADGIDARFGAVVRYHVAPRARLDPWLGASVGFESFSMDRGDVKGVGVFALALAGMDLRVADKLALGPTVGFGPTVGSSSYVTHTHGGDQSAANAFGMFSGTVGARAVVSF